MRSSLVSICMITYNHEAFIRDAIEGVLMQQTDFSYELVIGEDSSTDNTREICEEYARQYPELIRLLPSEKNLGMMSNFIRTLEACAGKYIALCEGDDYWTDPMKLQKQIDFLEVNSQFSLCFHNAEIHNEIKQIKHVFSKYSKNEYSVTDLFNKWLIPTASVVFRNVITDHKIPDYFFQATHGDLALFFYLSDFGLFYYLNEVMSVYRIHKDSLTVNSFIGINHNEMHLTQLKAMNDYFGKKYQRDFNDRIVSYLLSNSYLYAKTGDFKKSVKKMREAFKINGLAGFKYFQYVSKTIFFWAKGFIIRDLTNLKT